MAHDTIALRLHPGDDLKASLQSIAAKAGMSAGVVISLVGSLSSASLRYAGAESATRLEGPLEIVSATGTINKDTCHIHIAVADGAGTTYGGHLLDDCIVFTTAELVILDLSQTWQFDRKLDAQTTYLELEITAVGLD